MKLKISLLSLLVLALFSCESDSKEQELVDVNFNQSVFLASINDGLIAPAYADLQEKSSFLKVAIEAFSLSPDSTKLVIARERLYSTYMAWQKVSLYDFGPALERELKSNVNVFPCDTGALEMASSNANLNWDLLSSKTIKGFPALDYLLNHADHDQVVQEFQSNSRPYFLFNMTVDLDSRINLVANAWKTYQGGFKSSLGTSIGSSTGLIVNSLNQHYERFFRDGKLGIPIGVRSSGIPRPQDCEAYFGAYSFDLMKSNFEAITALYLGGAGIGLDDYLVAADAAALDAIIKTQMSIVSSKINSFPSSLPAAIQSRPADLLDLYSEMQKLIVYLKVDLPSRLGILITYQDNDGD